VGVWSTSIVGVQGNIEGFCNRKREEGVGEIGGANLEDTYNLQGGYEGGIWGTEKQGSFTRINKKRGRKIYISGGKAPFRRKAIRNALQGRGERKIVINGSAHLNLAGGRGRVASLVWGHKENKKKKRIRIP